MIENTIEWFQNKTNELENDLRRKNALLDIKAMILNSEKEVLNDIIHNACISQIFECLNKSDEQETGIICVILSELLNEMTASELLESYGDSLHKSLSHTLDEVKRTVLKLLEKKVDGNVIGTLVNNHFPLLVDATSCIASQDRSTAQGAISLLIELGSHDEGLNVLFSDSIMNKLKEVMITSDTVRFRVYEIIVAVSKLSQQSLTKAVSSGLMENLLSEVFSSDILIQLNALELLSSLASVNHGLNYLQEQTVIQNLADKLLKLNEEPLSVMLLPGMIEFFGNICTSQPEHFTNEYPQIMDLLFNSLDTSDDILLGVIITEVGKIGSSCSGRLALNKYKDQLTGIFFKKLGKILTTKNDVAVSAMNCLCKLIKNINNDAKLSIIAQEWFQSVTPNALDSIVGFAKLPFVEFRLAAFAVLKALATQGWGVGSLNNYPGMIEFLTDRSTEFNKDCKQIKFDIVFNMVHHPNIEQIVSQQVLLNLREFVKEGPFYVPTNIEMATEGAL